MSKQIQDAYIVAATHPGGQAQRHVPQRAPRRHAGHVLRGVVAQVPGLDPAEIGDVIVGCAMPEAEQGMNVARIGLLLAGPADTCRASPSTASARPACRRWPMRRQPHPPQQPT